MRKRKKLKKTSFKHRASIQKDHHFKLKTYRNWRTATNVDWFDTLFEIETEYQFDDMEGEIENCGYGRRALLYPIPGILLVDEDYYKHGYVVGKHGKKIRSFNAR